MKTTLLTAAVLLVLATTSFATETIPLVYDIAGSFIDSGWEVDIPNTDNYGVVVDLVADNYLLIEITKSFLPSETPDFEPVLFEFRQTAADVDTVATIVIADESVMNFTGVTWTNYHWSIIDDDAEAAFDSAATDASNFSINPFSVKTWGSAPAGWDSDHSSSLDVYLAGGDTGVAPFTLFRPGEDSGSLYIDVNLDSAAPADFTLQQVPTTPEPTTMALLAIGAVGFVVRRRR